MARAAASIVVNLCAGALALVLGALLLDDVALRLGGVVVAALVFTAIETLVEPALRRVAHKRVPALLGGISLVATFVSLVATVVVTDGLRISGAATWVLATVVVWVIAFAARLLLPMVLFTQVLSGRDDERGVGRR